MARKRQKIDKKADISKILNPDILYPTSSLKNEEIELRHKAYNDIITFVKLIAPWFMLSAHHEEMLLFLADQEHTHKLLLIPRGHSKSLCMGFYVAWRIVRDPRITILYASSTATLAEQQLAFIKNLLTSNICFKFFPSLITKEENKRARWTQQQIKVDHVLRNIFGVRDDTITVAGVGKGITGLHFDLLILDDITAPNTDADPWSATGREKVRRWVSQAASILNAGGEVAVIGTRYHPDDIYQTLIDMKEYITDDNGNVLDEKDVYKVLQREVECDGNFLFPRRQHIDGKYYGFDWKILKKIEAQYVDKAQFLSQYYNKTSVPELSPIKQEYFQYYNRNNLNYTIDCWRLGSTRLTVYAAIDLASTVSKKSDYTSLVVVGLDNNGFRYILDIYRIQTNTISQIADLIYNAYMKWKFIKLRAETNAFQGMVIKQIQEILRKRNCIFSWDEKHQHKEKRLRILSTLEPLYAQKIIFHYKGGNCILLENELLDDRPRHDDISDALASCCEMIQYVPATFKKIENITYHPKFGGVL